MPYFDQILVSLFPRKNSVRLSIFHSGHFCTGMSITRGHTPIYKNCSKDRAETSYFLSYIVFLHVSSLPVLLKSLSTYINLHCHFSWQLWISTIERFRPSFPHASLQSTKSTKTESKSNHQQRFVRCSFTLLPAVKSSHRFQIEQHTITRVTTFWIRTPLLSSHSNCLFKVQASTCDTTQCLILATLTAKVHVDSIKKTCLPEESRNLFFLNPWHVRSV